MPTTKDAVWGPFHLLVEPPESGALREPAADEGERSGPETDDPETIRVRSG